MPPPVYIVKPKNIFKHPFNKFDLDKPTNRESQNDDITDYFNYGFNEDTMNIYGKLVKRNIQVLDESINPTYFDAPSQLMRLNDQIPMDFGGFCKFFDPSIFIDPQATQEELEHNSDFHNGQRLFKNLIAVTLLKKPEYPLIDFVKGMYRLDPNQENWLCDVMDQIQQNLQLKYQDIMKKLIDKKNNPTGTATQKQTQNGAPEETKKSKQEGHVVPWQSKESKKQQEDGQQKMQQQSSKSSDQSGSDDDSESDESQSDDKKKKKNKDKDKEKSRSKDKDRSKKDKDKDRDRDRKDNKHKKIKKDSRSKKDKDRRDKDRDRDRKKDKDKKKEKSSKKKNDRDRSRSRKKDKRKKRRD